MVKAMNIDCYYSSNSDEFYLVYILYIYNNIMSWWANFLSMSDSEEEGKTNLKQAAP